MKKYEFTGEVKLWLGRTLHQIRAVVAFGEIAAGEVGGWIEKEENLDHEGNAWVYGDAWVYGNARVCGDAQVYDNAQVWGNAQVCGDAWVCGKAQVYGDARVFKRTHILTIGPIGSRHDITTFFRTKDLEIGVKCGCFRGNIEKFAEQVKATHGESDYAKQYMLAVELAKISIDLTPEEE